MDDKDWTIIKTLSEEKSVTKAAKRLFVSQPALSYRVNKLQEELGVNLFYKGPKGLEFTSEGKVLLGYSTEMLKHLQNMKDRIVNADEDIKGELRLGISSNFAQYRLPLILKEFSREYPNIQFNVSTGWSTYIKNLIEDSSVHLGILRGNYNWLGEKILLNKEQLYLISKTEIKLDDLSKTPLINYKTDVSLNQLINTWWNDRFSVPPFVTMDIDRQETCKEMVKNGLGFALMPEICLKPTDNLFTIPLTYSNGDPVLRNTWLMYYPNTLSLKVASVFVDFLKNNYLN